MQGKSAAEVCRATGVARSSFDKLLHLQMAPITCWGCKPGTWKYLPSCERIAECFQRTTDMVFPLEMYCFTAEKVLNRAHGEVEMMSLENIADLPSPLLDPLDVLLSRDYQGILSNILDSLTPRKARVLRLRFGPEDGNAHTREEIGKEFGVTCVRIQQIEYMALNQIRDAVTDWQSVLSFDR